MKKTIKQFIESLAVTRPGYVKALKEMAEAGIVSPDATMDAPAEAADTGGDHKTALMNALKALCDEADTLDEGELMKKFKAILKLIKGDSSSGSDPEPDSSAEESRRKGSKPNLQEQVAQMQAEKTIRKAAGVANVSLSETLVEALARPGMTDEQAKAVVAELKGSTNAGGQRPRSAAPLATGAAGVKGGSQPVQRIARQPGSGSTGGDLR